MYYNIMAVKSNDFKTKSFTKCELYNAPEHAGGGRPCDGVP